MIEDEDVKLREIMDDRLKERDERLLRKFPPCTREDILEAADNKRDDKDTEVSYGEAHWRLCSDGTVEFAWGPMGFFQCQISEMPEFLGKGPITVELEMQQEDLQLLVDSLGIQIEMVSGTGRFQKTKWVKCKNVGFGSSSQESVKKKMTKEEKNLLSELKRIRETLFSKQYK